MIVFTAGLFAHAETPSQYALLMRDVSITKGPVALIFSVSLVINLLANPSADSGRKPVRICTELTGPKCY